MSSASAIGTSSKAPVSLAPSASGSTPLLNKDLGELLSLFSTVVAQQEKIAASANQIGRDQSDLSKRMDTWDDLVTMNQNCVQLKQDFQGLDARIGSLEEMQKKRFEEAAERVRQAAIAKGLVITFISIAALKAVPIAAGAALGGGLRVTLHANGAKEFKYPENQYSNAEWFKQFLIGCATGLGAGAAGAAANPIIALAGNPLAGRIVFQAVLNAGNTVVEKKINGKPIHASTLVIALAAGAGGALAANGVQQLVDQATPDAVRIIHAGAVAATNAAVNRGIVNACEGKPLGDGVPQAVAIAFPIGAAVQAVNLHREAAAAKEPEVVNEQEALLKAAKDYTKQWVEDSVKEGWELPQGSAVDEVVGKIVMGQPVELKYDNQMFTFKLNEEIVMMAGGVTGVGPMGSLPPGPRLPPAPKNPLPPGPKLPPAPKDQLPPGPKLPPAPKNPLPPGPKLPPAPRDQLPPGPKLPPAPKNPLPPGPKLPPAPKDQLPPGPKLPPAPKNPLPPLPKLPPAPKYPLPENM